MIETLAKASRVKVIFSYPEHVTFPPGPERVVPGPHWLIFEGVTQIEWPDGYDVKIFLRKEDKAIAIFNPSDISGVIVVE